MDNMKKIRLIYLLWLVVLATSCEDFLDLKPKDNLIKEEFWQNKEQVNTAIAACYASMNETGFMDKIIMWGELRAEMLVSVKASGEQQNMLKGFVLPTSSIVNWASFYKTINYCNGVLAFASDAQEKDPTFSEDQLKIYEGEALAIRALTYFFLVRNFKEVPLIVTATQSDQTNFYVKKEKENIVIERIIEDLKTALIAIPVSYSKSVAYDKGRMTKGAVLALLADVYLWNNQFDECIDACSAIEKLNKFQLVSGSKWFNEIFFAGNSDEGIFELQFSDLFGTLRNYFDMANLTFKAYNGIQDLFGDVLFDARANLATFDENNNAVFKFAGKDPISGEYRSSQQFYNTWIFYRYADVLLMQAEAYLYSLSRQNLDSAYTLISNVHERATGTPLEPIISLTDLKESLLLERQKEFAFEAKRWYDLLRFARRNNFEDQSLIIDMALKKTGFDDYVEIMSYYSDTASYFLPIFQGELNINPNLEQNPFYVK